MLCFLNVGHVTVGAVTLDVFPKASNGKNAWIGFTLGFDPFHVCGYTAINSLRGKKKLEPGFAAKRRCKQRQILAQQSKVRVYKNGSNDFIRKEFLNSDVLFECFKVLMKLT